MLPVERWRTLADQVKAEVCEKGFNKEKNSFVQYYGSDQLDSSLLMLARVGFLPPDDPRIIGTVDAIQRELMVDGFVQRYPTSDDDSVDGLPAGEGTFLMTTFWLVDNLALIGREQEARELFERLRGLQNDVGMFSEEYDTKAKRLIGNFPQAFSHLGFIVSASHLSAAQPSPLGHPRHQGDVIMATDHYDVVIIGSGAGGGTLAWKLAPDRQADPAPRAGRLPPPRARQLGHRGGVPARQVHDDRDLARCRRRRVHARAELLRRRQHQVLRRGAVPVAA